MLFHAGKLHVDIAQRNLTGEIYGQIISCNHVGILVDGGRNPFGQRSIYQAGSKGCHGEKA